VAKLKFLLGPDHHHRPGPPPKMPPRRTYSGLARENKKMQAQLDSLRDELSGSIEDFNGLKAKYTKIKKVHKSEFYSFNYALFCGNYASPGKC
jgi:hypothetical protein